MYVYGYVLPVVRIISKCAIKMQTKKMPSMIFYEKQSATHFIIITLHKNNTVRIYALRRFTRLWSSLSVLSNLLLGLTEGYSQII